MELPAYGWLVTSTCDNLRFEVRESCLLRKPELMRGFILSVPKWRGEGAFRETKFSRKGRESEAPGMEEAGACLPAAPG